MQELLITENSPQSWQCLYTFTGNASWVYGVPITPDGKTLVSHSFDEIGIWDLDSGEVVNILIGHSDCIFSLSISPDGQTLASGCLDKTVKLWNIKTGKLIYTLSERADPIYSVAFSPDGKILASGGANKYKTPEGQATTIYLWNPNTGELMGKLTGHSKRVDSLAFSPDGNVLASHSYDKTIKLWNLKSRQPIYSINTESDCCTTVAITPNGENLISTGTDCIKIWSLPTGELLRTLSKDLDYVRSFAISPDGETLVTCGNPYLKVWDLNSGKLIHTLTFEQPITVSFSPNGKLLASGSATCHLVEDVIVAGFSVWQVPEELCPGIIDNSTIETQKVATIRDNLNSDGYFNLESIEDARQRTTTSIARRQGQPKFRSDLLKAYQGRCAITDFDAEQALEAAHIYPYKGNDTNNVWNGLLLRADIHTLFDLYLITVHPETKEILIAPELKSTSYSKLHGKKLSLPKDESLSPRREVLKWHYQQCNWVEVS